MKVTRATKETWDPWDYPDLWAFLDHMDLRVLLVHRETLDLQDSLDRRESAVIVA
jgi:hypothetical protein